MRVIYLTTSLDADDYVEFNSHWKVSLNPSNQNFHNKVIRSLGLTNDIEVISMRPFSRKVCSIKKLEKSTKVSGKITWHYLEVKRLRVMRYFSFKKQASEILKTLDLNYAVIVTDTINPRVVSLATALVRDLIFLL